jgi:hypothetical protein
MGVKPGTEEPPLSGPVEGENIFGGRGAAPFDIGGTRVVPRGLEIGGCEKPTP